MDIKPFVAYSLMVGIYLKIGIIHENIVSPNPNKFTIAERERDVFLSRAFSASSWSCQGGRL